MITITPDRHLDESELTFEYIKASGPGGQNINKVSTAVRLFYNLTNSTLLDLREKERLSQLAGSRLTKEGILIIEAKRYRSQEQNRLDAINRFVSLIKAALIIPKNRINTHPSKSSRASRLEEKKRRGVQKTIRKINLDDFE